MTDTVLELVGVTKRFDGLVAVDDLSLTIPSQSIQALIGPNGAGKTTAFNLITGVFPPTDGEIRWHGGDDDEPVRLDGRQPHDVAALGISRTFQNLQIFDNMTALENVMMGRYLRSSGGFVASMLHLPLVRRATRENAAAARHYLELVGIADRAELPATAMPFGELRLLELARALATEPQLLLLDEPASGLNRADRDRLAELVLEIRGLGVTVLLVEHDMDFVMNLADRVAVLDRGKKLADDPPEVVQADERVIAAYLGEDAAQEVVG